MRIIITETQFKELILNENFIHMISEASTPTNILDNLISFVTKSSKTPTKTFINSEIRTAFGLGVRGNLTNLEKKLTSIKDSGKFLTSDQIKVLYSGLHNNQIIRDSFESFFINNSDISTLLRGYRKAKLQGDSRMLNKTLTDLEKFIPEPYIEKLITKLPSEDVYKLTKKVDFNELKKTIKNKIIKDGKLDKKTIYDYLESNEVKNLQLDPKEQEELINLINLKSPKTFEFLDLVKKHNPTTDGPFFEYLIEKGYITKENYTTNLKIYGSKTLLQLENIFKKFSLYYTNNPIKATILIILSTGLITGVIYLKDIIILLSELGWIKVGGYVKKDEAYIVNKVREFLNSEKPTINKNNIKNIPENEGLIEGQEINVVNPETGLIALKPGIYVEVNGELVKSFIWDDETKKLTPKAVVSKPSTEPTKAVVSKPSTEPTKETFKNDIEGFKKWYETPEDKGGYGGKIGDDEKIRGNKDKFQITVLNQPFETYEFKDSSFIKK